MNQLQQQQVMMQNIQIKSAVTNPMVSNVGPMSGVGPTLPASSVGFALGAQGVEELRIKK